MLKSEKHNYVPLLDRICMTWCRITHKNYKSIWYTKKKLSTIENIIFYQLYHWSIRLSKWKGNIRTRFSVYIWVGKLLFGERIPWHEYCRQWNFYTDLSSINIQICCLSLVFIAVKNPRKARFCVQNCKLWNDSNFCCYYIWEADILGIYSFILILLTLKFWSWSAEQNCNKSSLFKDSYIAGIKLLSTCDVFKNYENIHNFHLNQRNLIIFF